MTRISTIALGLALALGGSATMIAVTPANAAKADAKAPKMNLSKGVQGPAAEVQKAQATGDEATAKAKLAEAEAAIQTPDDKYIVGQLKYNTAAKANDMAGVAAATDMMLDSGKAPADLEPKLLQNQGVFALQAKNYQKATAAFQRLAQLTPNDPEAQISLAEVYAASKQTPQAIETVGKAIAAKKAAGQPVPESWYKRRLAFAYDSKQAELTTTSSLELVSAYPTQDNWRDSLIIFRDSSKLDEQSNLDLMRLQRAARALKGEADYYEYANSATMRGLPGEAKAVIDEGVAAKALDGNKPTFKELNSIAAGKIGGDKASLPKLETQARSAANGKLALATADAYLGYGEYAKAADLYKLALSKGGADAAIVNTRLGIALARSGQKQPAIEAFSKVTTGPRATIAKFWTVWVNQQA